MALQPYAAVNTTVDVDGRANVLCPCCAVEGPTLIKIGPTYVGVGLNEASDQIMRSG